MALEIGGSSPLRHPICKDRHSKFIFYKNAYFGFKKCYCKFCLVYKKNYSLEGNAMGNEILNLENRISQLRGRTGRENGKIIKKLQRRLRKLTNNA